MPDSSSAACVRCTRARRRHATNCYASPPPSHPRTGLALCAALALTFVSGTALATPGTPIVSDGGTYTTSIDHLAASWNAADPAHEILEYQYRLTRESANGPIVRDWRSVGLANSVDASGLSLQSGQSYYFGVRARYGSDRYTATGSSNGITVDNAAPSVTNIDDGGAYTNLRSVLSVSWTGSDAVSGVRGYRVSLGTTPGATNVKAWTNVGTNTTATVGGLSLHSGSTYYFNIEATDVAGNVRVVSSDGITSDQVVPSVTARDDGDVTTNSSSLHATWSGSDALSQIGEYLYELGTAADPDALVAWTSRGLQTSVTVNGLTLSDGVIYYFRVKAIDGAGNFAVAGTDGIRAQLSGPVVNAVGDGGDYTPAADSLTATWVASGTHITEYRYAIGTSAGATNVKPWTSAGLNTMVTVGGLSLQNGVTYYFSVRAYDDSGRYGTGNSDGIMVDLVDPTVNFVTDAGEYTRDSGSLSFSYSATDAESGIHEYSYAIGTPEAPQSIVPLTSAGLDTSVTVSGLHLSDGELYVIGVYATDNVGHYADGASDGITVDTSPPDIVFLEDDGDVTSFNDRLTASWYATDAGVGIAGYSYAIGTTPGATNVVGWTDAGLNTSVTRTGLALEQGVAYYFTLRATDRLTQVARAVSDGIRVDSSAPTISEVTVDGLTGTTATVRWLTDKPTTGVVDYGKTAQYGEQAVAADFSQEHAVILNQLTPGQLYHYRITATDDAGAHRSTSDLTFTTPDEADQHQRLSPAGLSYAAPAILQSEARMAFRLDNGQLWVGDLDPATGGFATGDGRNYRMDTGTEAVTNDAGPELGRDTSGWAVFYAKKSRGVVQTWRSRLNGDAGVAEALTSGAPHESPMPTTSLSLSQTRIVNLAGTLEQGGDLAWFAEGSPNSEHVIEDLPPRQPSADASAWADDGTRIVAVDSSTGQLFFQSAGNDQRTTITNDAGHKSAPQAWQAPEYDGETIVAAVVDDTAIGIYRDLGGSYWTQVTTLPIPVESNGDVITTPRAFVVGDKSYLALTIVDAAPIGQPKDSEIWIVDLDGNPNARYAQRCDDGRSQILRSHARVFIGNDSVFTYYNAQSGSTQELWLCRTDIVPSAMHPLVDTELGRVQGIRGAGADAFLNIPYAQPPVDNRRWRVTEPATEWNDVRVGVRLPERCPQPDPTQPDSAIVGAEDCLYLNVWTPSDRVPGQPLPVMVFVHGGGNRNGGTADPLSVVLDLNDTSPLYEGTALADRGNVVVVTVQYRLGALGYLADPALAMNSPTGTAGNYGLFDLLEALRWVQHNVAAFGGDASRVLLFGQSAGARDVSVLLASPLASGLFSRALLESGAGDIDEAAEAEQSGHAFLSEMGLLGVPNLLARLRALPLSRIVLAQSALPVGFNDSAFGPYVDGYIVDQQPIDIIGAGAHNAVPFIVGSNAAEYADDYHDLSPDDYYELSAALVPANRLAELYALYPLSAFPTPTDAYVAMLTDHYHTCSARTAARVVSQSQSAGVYRYQFRRILSTNAREGDGAYHGTELLYLFQHMDGVHFSANDDDRTVEALMLDYWTRFAATGDPNNPNSPAWPRYDASDDSYLGIDTHAAPGTHLSADRCDFWDSVHAD